MPKKRELTTFNIVMVLIFSAVVVVTYISNVIAVDRILGEITTLEKKEADLKQQNEQLRASINTLSSYLRIQERALKELHLVHSRQQPFSLPVYNMPPQSDASE